MKYYVLLTGDVDDAAIIEGHPDEVTDVIAGYKFRKAVSLVKEFPALPGYSMDPEFPDNRLLTDSLDNTDELLIFSEALTDIVKSLEQENIELLPVKILDHRGKVASEKYNIINVVGTVDCIDWDNSKYVVSPMDSDELHRIKKLVLIESNIPQGTHILRLHKKPGQILVSEKFKQSVETLGLTGMRFVATEDFKGR
ncbi:hypothetical protein BTA51_22945 [Hahella sp. CCB-MM4]|uniref:Imm43 family immunity protein n=1 Tax=Hahella sp. (strain CCB-MM4) TaxID=1926491 RepID=UPI000B9B2046|nr:DUF1629 domain-containing protein [Hahella sp. CCB-MM4]OZG70967.1 hypothetical protein BTA51_22945 [Hahella sp. CCB-MM4]